MSVFFLLPINEVFCIEFMKVLDCGEKEIKCEKESRANKYCFLSLLVFTYILLYRINFDRNIQKKENETWSKSNNYNAMRLNR